MLTENESCCVSLKTDRGLGLRRSWRFKVEPDYFFLPDSCAYSSVLELPAGFGETCWRCVESCRWIDSTTNLAGIGAVITVCEQCLKDVPSLFLNLSNQRDCHKRKSPMAAKQMYPLQFGLAEPFLLWSQGHAEASAVILAYVGFPLSTTSAQGIPRQGVHHYLIGATHVLSSADFSAVCASRLCFFNPSSVKAC